MVKIQDTFERVVPIHFYKGKDENGNEVMKFSGVASTPSKDADEEYLDPSGFESDYFLKSGFFNWNHQTNKDPSAVIGKPTKVSVTKDNEYEVSGYLFPDSLKARQVWDLQKVLEKQGMALGLSIEGKVLERDPNNKKLVKKAKITGCAITPNPKNEDTTMSIIKAQGFNELSAYENEDEETKEKAMMVDSPSGEAVTKESLDNSLKTTKYGDQEEKRLEKSEVYDKLLVDLPSVKGMLLKEVYKLAEKIQKSIDMENIGDTKITIEALDKAYEVLGISKGTVSEEVVEETTTEEAPEVTETTEGDVVEKSETEISSLSEVDLQTQKDLLEKALAEVNSRLTKGDDATEEVEETEETEEVEETEEGIEKSTDNSNDLIKGISDLIKGEISGIKDDMTEKFQAVGRLQKSILENQEDLDQRLSDIENEPEKPKSVMTRTYVEKSFDGDIEKGEGGKQVLSVSNSKHKRVICDTLTKAVTEGDLVSDENNAKIRKSIMTYESSNTVNDYLVKAAAKVGISLVK